MHSQTASQVGGRDFAPDLQRLSGSLVFTGSTGLGAPAGAERLSIAIAGVEIEGAFPAMASANQALVARLTAGRIPASEIFTAAQDLEAAYAEAGFVLARVVLPAQELRDGGRLRLVVVDGFVERVDADAVPAPVRSRIEGIVAPVAGRPGLRLEEIERALLIAGDTFGVALESALARGETPGAAQLVLDGEYRPVTGFVGLDRGVASDLGNWTLDAGVEMNSLMGLGETVYLRFSGHPQGNDANGTGGLFSSTPRLRTLAGGAVFPLGRDGLNFNIEGVQSQTTPSPDAGAARTTSKYERVSLRLSYPWIRTRSRTLAGRLVFDATSDRQDILAPDGRVPVYRDRLSVLRLGGTLVQTLPGGGQVEFDALFSQGLDAFGARGADDATPTVPLSRAGGDHTFSKLGLSVELARPLGEQFVGVLSARGQTAFGRPLLKSEQIGLAGPGLLSGSEPGSVVGDSGWLVRGELRMPREVAAQGVPLRLVPYVFAATGSAYLHSPTALERARVSATSVGVGMELVSLPGARVSSASLRVELARGSRDDVLQTEGRQDETRLTVGGALRF